jgi:threonine/homoserine/homoserine lactone efflux protein
MKLLVLFIVTFFISFVGSIHPGPLNVSVIKKTLRKGLYKGLILAIGGVIPEIIYGYLAVAGLMIFKDYPQVFTIMNWLVVPILLLMGILSIRHKATNEAENQSVSTRKGFASIELIEGFLYSILNPQLLPFWIVSVSYTHLRAHETM